MNIVIFVTAKDQQEAQTIARALVNQKLVACANIVPGIQSVFWWEGKVDESAEALLILKTKKSLFNDVEKAVKKLHSYQNPEVIAMPITDGSEKYLRWVNESVQ